VWKVYCDADADVDVRGSSEQIGSANRLATALANSIESEQTKKRSAQMRGHVSGHPKNPATTGVRPLESRRSKTEIPGMLPAESDNCHTPVPLTQESWALAGDVDDCQSKLEQTALMSTALVSSIRVPSVKEYSLFDNHFSKAVESVLKNDICVSSARNAFNGAPCVAGPAVDEALLAKAPGYRASTASPCSGRFLLERPRKYSNDSSSSLSSVKSCEDSPSNVTGGRMLPPRYQRARACHQMPDILHSSAFHPVHDLPPQIPVCRSSPFSEFSSTVESACDPDVTPSTVPSPYMESDHYSSPNEPMTLPRISTDLNPNAPDFVFRPATQTSSVPPDVPDLTASSSGSFFIPGEMSDAVAGRWSEAMLGMSDGGALSAMTALDISMPTLAVDMTPRQWTVPNTLLQESLTFG